MAQEVDDFVLQFLELSPKASARSTKKLRYLHIIDALCFRCKQARRTTARDSLQVTSQLVSRFCIQNIRKISSQAYEAGLFAFFLTQHDERKRVLASDCHSHENSSCNLIPAFLTLRSLSFLVAVQNCTIRVVESYTYLFLWHHLSGAAHFEQLRLLTNVDFRSTVWRPSDEFGRSSVLRADLSDEHD